MSFSAALRRAASAIPSAGKAYRNYHIAPLRPHRFLHLSNITSLPFLSLSRLSSSSTDASLLQVIESEIKFARKELLQVEGAPKGFPFKILDDKGTKTITLNRAYRNEKIEVTVYMPEADTESNEESGFNIEADSCNTNGGKGYNVSYNMQVEVNISEGVGPTDDGGEGYNVSCSMQLEVKISKGVGPSLVFNCRARPDEIDVNTISFEVGETNEGGIPYVGRRFKDLDENLQNALHKYLEKRGISPFTTDILLEYMMNKDKHEYLFWLKKMKQFIEK